MIKLNNVSVCLWTEPAQRNKYKLVTVEIKAHWTPQNTKPGVHDAKYTLYTLTLRTQIIIEGVFLLAQGVFA